MNIKNGKFNYYFPYEIKLVDDTKKDRFKFLLYYGLLNHINCFLNYNGVNKYSCEYFYFNCNSLENLPKFNIRIGKEEYVINNYDTFNSKIRKRYILINIPDNYHTEIYKTRMNQHKIEESKKNKKKNNSNNMGQKEKKNIELSGKNEIELNGQNNIIESNEENEINENNLTKEKDEKIFIIETLHESLQFYFYFDDVDEKSNLFGIFNIDEINPQNPEYLDEKMLEKYELFYDYYKKLEDKKKCDNYFEKIKKFEKDKDLTDLVLNYSYFKSTFKYKYYIIYANMCLFFYRHLMDNKDKILEEFIINFNKIESSNLSITQKIRIMRFTCQECYKSESDLKNFNLLLLDSLPENNIYKLAFDYNKQIINNLKEQSELYFPFLQLDNYILFNYYVNSNSYTLSMEPLTLTKNYLLSLYEPFIFVSIEMKKIGNKIRLSCQCTNNDITMINKYGLFGEKAGSSSFEKNKNLIIPISMELLNEKNGHSKKFYKNKRNISPIYFFEKNNIIILEESKQKSIDKRGESSRIMEHFIKYKNKNLVYELKTNFIYKDIISDTKFFTGNDFKDLYEKMKDILTSSKIVNNEKLNISNCEINDEKMQINEIEKIGFDEKFDDTKL